MVRRVTTSENEWQQVTTSGTTSDKWQGVTTSGTTSDKEWQRVILRVTTNDNK